MTTACISSTSMAISAAKLGANRD